METRWPALFKMCPLWQITGETIVKYIQRFDEEGFEVKSKEMTRWACCDCGLVHDIVFVAGRKGTEIGVAARRNNRATSARRRNKTIKRFINS